MPLLKVVNPDKNTIYLESATYLPHEGDREPNSDHKKESMYLVVRGLKAGNLKIVSANRDEPL